MLPAKFDENRSWGFPEEDEDRIDPIRIFEDNAATLTAITSGRISPKLRHMRIKYHWIVEAVQSGIIQPLKVGTDKQLADGFTKALSPRKFIQWKDHLTKPPYLQGSVGTFTGTGVPSTGTDE